MNRQQTTCTYPGCVLGSRHFHPRDKPEEVVPVCTCPGGWDEGEWSSTAAYDQDCGIHGWEDGDGPILTPATA